MNEAKYNVLFMRDDASVRRFRVSHLMLKVACWVLALLLAVAVAGLWAGLTFFSSNRALVRENASLVNQLNEAKIRLERLENVAKILNSYDPQDLQALLSSAPPKERGQDKAQEKPQEKPQDKAQDKAQDKPQDKDSAESKAEAAGPAVGVEAMKVRPGRNSLSVSFGLNNLQPSQVLSGQAELFVIGKDGASYHAEANTSDLSFQIQRYKKISTTFNLPEGLDKKAITALRLDVKLPDGKVIFSESYPLSQP